MQNLKEYRRPLLQRLGSVEDITQADRHDGADGGSDQNSNGMAPGPYGGD